MEANPVPNSQVGGWGCEVDVVTEIWYLRY